MVFRQPRQSKLLPPQTGPTHLTPHFYGLAGWIERSNSHTPMRARIMIIHSRKMNYKKDDVNFTELARSTEDFNGAQLKAVCVEAGMEALRRGATQLVHEDYMVGIHTVQAKKKTSFNYYA